MQCLKHVLTVAMVCGCGAIGSGSLKAVASDSHSREGPHHGMVINLGEDAFHAELVHDGATDTATIYILDARATKPVPIVARTITLDMLAAGKAHSFRLPAKPQADDPSGTASAFALADNYLGQILDVEGTSGYLVVEIEGKIYVGHVGGHDHSHEH